ncbi:MAG: HAMP domain-containing protein [Chloroflexi bacterium]|nr:MAG: HAMP domain-containing protein [Chloroflexota bacterium]
MTGFLERVSHIFHSFRFRLAFLFVFLLGIVVLLFSIFIYTRQSNDLREAAVDRLEYKAQKLADYFRTTSGDSFYRAAAGIPYDPESGESFLQDMDVLAYIDSSGKVIRSWGPPDTSRVSLWVEEGLKEENLDNPITNRLIPATIEIENSPVDYLTVVVPVSINHRLAGYFLIGNPIDPDNQMPQLLLSLILGVAITLGGALFGGLWLANQAIHPVKKITDTARTISETDLSRRLQLNRKDEMGELADTFDDMLARLEAAFERQRQFTADASHELRTPLSIIELEASRALAANRSIKEYERVLRVIKSENQHMIRLVNNLLTLARMDSGQIAMEKEELDLSDVALEVVERLAPIAVEEGVRLSAGELPELPVVGDREYLTRMLSNLVENGIKYTTGEERRVMVSSGIRSENGSSEAWVRVIDNGQGIDPEHLPHIFDRFYQVDLARTRSHNTGEGDDHAPSGAGLGLAIAQSIAITHGGRINVESEVRKGTVFEVRIPGQPPIVDG